jgi:hypothetical protein
MQVGVATILDSARGLRRTEMQALNALADVAIFTYYGNDNGHQARTILKRQSPPSLS